VLVVVANTMSLHLPWAETEGAQSLRILDEGEGKVF